MIGSGLKKLAKENEMRVAKGVAYGSLRGYAATLSEGAGWKQIVFTTIFPDAVKKTELTDQVNMVDVKKKFRVQNIVFSGQTIHVSFLDNPGTMKKIYGFLDWFIPLLQKYEASGANICSQCGTEIAGGRWVLISGIAYYMHGSCADRVRTAIESENQQRKDDATGSYVMGAVGAFSGAALGAVLWAVVLLAGYVASVVGLAIGWLADKGYNLLRGKQGKAKVLILMLAVVFGVVAGTAVADIFSLVQMISSGELPGAMFADIPELIMILLNDQEYLAATGKNMLMGLVFAGLGVFALLRQTGREVADTPYIELN